MYFFIPSWKRLNTARLSSDSRVAANLSLFAMSSWNTFRECSRKARISSGLENAIIL